MRKPIHLGGSLVPERTHPTFQQWLKDTFSADDPREDPAARELQAENARRFAKHLARCPRASRTS
ncbi:MAG: hypothetical protein JWO52_4064 [Gammaproteobacteria bacterium]|nr:hypothetical protein [Gammaproteobacteria bacterium]